MSEPITIPVSMAVPLCEVAVKDGYNFVGHEEWGLTAVLKIVAEGEVVITPADTPVIVEARSRPA